MFIIVELYFITLAVAFFALLRLMSVEKNRFRVEKRVGLDDTLPTVSVCIPVRNETHVMSECLELVLASDYPKLEVIVLDDNSIDDTPNIVRAFAHAGVRFISGEEPPKGWLGKNYSLKRLLDEASGRYVIFMDADTRVSSKTITLLIDRLLSSRMDMLSVIPQRKDYDHASFWFSTLRFLWDMVLSTHKKPSASSAIWLVDRRRLLDDFKGFDLWRDSVQPERHIAEGFARSDDYQLIISTPELGVSFQKKWRSQVDTSRRLLMQRFGDSLFGVSLVGCLLVLVIIPQIGLISSLIFGHHVEAILSAFVIAFTTLTLLMYYRLFWVSKWWLSVFVMPVVLWQELILLILSFVSYSRGTVEWKGRQISRPTRT